MHHFRRHGHLCGGAGSDMGQVWPLSQSYSVFGPGKKNIHLDPPLERNFSLRPFTEADVTPLKDPQPRLALWLWSYRETKTPSGVLR